MPYIIQPSRHTSLSRTLINNIFSNFISKDIICGNITANISDHLAQFLVSQKTFANPPFNKSNVFQRGWKKFDQENVTLDYFDIDWSNLLNLNEENVSLSTNNFLSAMNSLLIGMLLLKKSVNANLNLKQNPGLHLVYKNQSLLKTNC